MGYEKVSVITKDKLLKWLDKIPDDAIIIVPAWGLNGWIRTATKKKPYASMDIRMVIMPELIKEADSDIRNLQKLKLTPFFWAAGEDKEIFTEEAFLMAHASQV